MESWTRWWAALVLVPAVLAGCPRTSGELPDGGVDAGRSLEDAGQQADAGDTGAAAGDGGTLILFPADSNIVDVKRAYGAKGDGVTDDTAAILRALTENNYPAAHCRPDGGPGDALDTFAARTVYLPEGVYKVSQTLFPCSSTVRLIGAGRDRTIIKLQDNAPGFTNPGAPKPLFESGYRVLDNALGNDAYANYLQHLTFDTGAGNLGARGVQFYASNSGAMEHVTIRSGDGARRGSAGLYLGEHLGPAYVKDVTVEGFDVGVYLDRKFTNNMVLEDITVRGQLVAGVVNETQSLQLLDLVSEGNAVALRSTFDKAATFLVRPRLVGTGSGAAIDVQGGGFLFVRDLSATGFASLIREGATDRFVGKTSIQEWSTHGYRVGPSSLTAYSETSGYVSLNLPIKKSPRHHDNDFTTWASVASFGATAGDDSDDDAPALQAAIDSGAQTIYFPYGRYTLKSEVIVRGSVRKIDFFFSRVLGAPGVRLRLRAPSVGDATVLENVDISNVDLVHEGAHAAVLRNARPNGCDVSNSSAATGEWFLDNVGPHGTYHFGGAVRVWIRQLNRGSTILQNSGAAVWFFGDNLETPLSGGDGVAPITVSDGGVLEVFGTYDPFSDVITDADGTLFNASGGSLLSVTFAGKVTSPGPGWPNVVHDVTATGTVHLDGGAIISTAGTTHRIVLPLYASPGIRP